MEKSRVKEAEIFDLKGNQPPMEYAGGAGEMSAGEEKTIMQALKVLANNLGRRGFNAQIFPNAHLALKRLLELVAGHSVGLGNSMTLKGIGLLDCIEEKANEVFYHLPGEAGEAERRALTADFYITSANAISQDGQIINIDGTGNRVAATCFGPANLIYVIGKNKIADTLDAALSRAKNAAVMLARHHNRKTPCAITGKCEDCLSPHCVCSITTIHRRKPTGINASVFLIDEELGL